MPVDAGYPAGTHAASLDASALSSSLHPARLAASGERIVHALTVVRCRERLWGTHRPGFVVRWDPPGVLARGYGPGRVGGLADVRERTRGATARAVESRRAVYAAAASR